MTWLPSASSRGNPATSRDAVARLRANYLASPPLVVAFALAGTLERDMTRADRHRKDGEPVYLKDMWPRTRSSRADGRARPFGDVQRAYADVFNGDARWHAIDITAGDTYTWEGSSTYVQNPPYFQA